MSSISPSPPDSSSPPLPQPISPPLTSPSTSPPPSQSNSTSPVATPPASHSLAPAATPPPPAEGPMATPPPTTVSPPPQSSTPPTITVSPPPQSSTPPPPAIVPPPASSPPPPSANPPSGSTPPPTTSPPPPPPSSSPPPPISPISSPPPSSSPPPPISPISSPPPPSTDPPTSSPPPPSSNPPPSSSPPPPPPVTPRNAPPPPTSRPPEGSPPPPSTQPPKNSPPPPASKPPENSPPPPVTKPQPRSPPPPASDPPSISPPPPASAPPKNSPPAPVLTPPPRTLSPPPPSPSLVPLGAPPNDNSSSNVSDSSGSTGGGGIGTAGTIAIGLVFGLILLGLVGTAACWCFWKRKKKASGANGGYILPTSVVSSPKSDSGLLKEEKFAANARSGSINGFVYSPAEPGGLGNSRPLYSYEELMVATDGFSAHNLLGQGGFGSVYKGLLADGREVAVKQLNIDGRQGEREFRAEVEIISRIHHRHLVSLVGYCISDYRRLLIYDYVPNNTLYFHLHGQGMPVLDWTRRVRIAVGAARGLAYLHEDCHPRVIHRDIKSSNILLDNNFEARVSDFGLAKLCQDADTHISTRVIGTFGYLAPEYATSGKLTEKSDVFSFGVVLLELITGRKPVDASKPLGEESVVEWGRPLLSQALDSRQLEELVDSTLEKNYDEREMFLLIEVAAACVRHSSAKRPQMGQVVRAFDSMATSDLTNGMRVGESEIFNSAEQSAEIRLFRRMGFGIQDFSTDFFSHDSRS